ncbi:hypothetical protein AWH56_011560 [Anaerobacillus isosaccharinicus]|uniref:Uncharacterized protein n=1 Tax=Anaerobacillus isosaccharinicus TaxID=1532552 RepID=A0A1S2M9N9_9BACI|nr:hypothetical protein [Anaerobacillus isosaccharinicus]MBA5588462.1 hypothetical protein [Anaerobacillus isosaccharinicus]QOY38112.1 hypothetical protein AWH56_011560 [Anaerobacillus isosaccharinicus]
MWEFLVARITVLITLGIGTLLVVLFPLINKENRYFAWLSLTIGVFIITILLYWVLGDEGYRGQFLGLENINSY